ncbi:hypothetical protein [Actinomycetospora chiangmaiensis]|uniref:hypothetical protein n=1 Tax=Actinomycetospora chiangmaiensis TaxID=402650 RepID=UPI0003A92AB1|nr:hypothetical protein [Actinomycetospora chiangmaiensis]
MTEPIALPRHRHRAPEPDAPASSPMASTASATPVWLPWLLIGGLAAIGLAALYSAFAGLSSSGTVAAGLLGGVILLGVTVLVGLAMRAVLIEAREAAALGGVVAGAALIAALASATGEGLGILAGLGGVVVAVGAVALASTGSDHDPLAAARLVGPVAGVGFVVLALREAVELASSTGSGGLGSIVGSLLAGVGLVAARYAVEPARISRIITTVAAVLGLIAVASSGVGDAAGWLCVGLALGVVALLFLPGPARVAAGEEPLPGLVSMRDSVRGLLDHVSSERTTTTGAPTPAVVELLRIVPWWFWITLVVGIVVAVAGLSEASTYDAAAKACTVVPGRSISIVRDTPECDAAFAGQDHGKMIAALGGLIALGPIVAVTWVKEKLAKLRS